LQNSTNNCAGLVSGARFSQAAPYVQQCLREVFGNHPLVGDIQDTGLVAALQFAEDKSSRKRFANESDIAWRCRTIGFEEGLIIRSTQGRMIMAPAIELGLL
jgi:putrescine---pyruvate transaminase